LAHGGASAIVFDILFKTADFGVNSANEAIGVMQQVDADKDWDSLFSHIRSAYNYDSMFVQSVKDAENVIACATLAPHKIYEHQSQWEPLSTALWQDIVGTKGTLYKEQIPSDHIVTWDLLDNIFPELANASHSFGLVNVVPDDDGVHRKEPLFHSYPNPELAPDSELRHYPLISIQTIAMLFGLKPEEIKIEPGKHVNMGQALGIFKDEEGELHTTYPNLSWEMVRALLEKKSQIASIQNPDSKRRIIDITHQIIIDKSEDGYLSAEVNDAQYLSHEAIEILSENPVFQEIWQNLPADTLEIDEDFSLWQENSKLILYDFEEDEEIELTPYLTKVLQEKRRKIEKLNPGKRMYLSSNLDMRYDPRTKKLSSNYIIFSPSVLEDLLQKSPEDFNKLQPGETLRLGDSIRIPVDDKMRMLVNYTGRHDTKRNRRAFKQVSYYDLVTDRIDPASFQGKIFVLGSTAPALFDLVSAPHESEFPGVLIHATLIENILNNNFIRILKDSYQLWGIIAIALICAVLVYVLPPLASIPLLLVLVVIYFLINMHFFDQGLYIGVARQMLVIVLSFLTVMVLRYLFEEKEKRFLNNAFKSYISPELIDIMVDSGTRPSLGGTGGVFTAYFTDIAGFSTFSEAIGSPEKLVDLLNEYLGEMTDILTTDRGTLDKYIGDAIVAIFGAPVPLEDHAQRACVVSLKMLKKLDELREKWKNEGDKWPVLVHQMRMRIGINTGPMVVGNMGSSLRMNYTMMGDTVNLAARLESAAKQYGVYIQISDETLQLIDKSSILSRPLDLIVVVGKSEPVLCHELLALKEDVNDDLLKLVELWQQARAAYLATDWELAIELFEQCLPYEPHHPDKVPENPFTPSHLFIERCREYQKDGLYDKDAKPWPKNTPWDGVFVASSK
ncbi:MAG: CHASE2 domain-containing protein, partial [Fibrobacter sp.]|nr:CHASE2 domain-containing protein [Fibrobacter sp.]